MPITRRSHALPLPAPELARLREALAPDYGAELWGEGLLVVRVPRAEPDIVNDLEAASATLPAGLVEKATQLLLVGDGRTHILPIAVLQELVQARIRSDRAACQAQRAALQPGGFALFTTPDDPRRAVRLALRVGRPRVADVGEEDLAAFVPTLGPLAIEPRTRAAAIAYLVADKDEVRVPARALLDDLHARFAEERERRDLAAKLAARSATPPPRPAPLFSSRSRDEFPGPSGHPAASTHPAHPEPARVAAAPVRRPPERIEWAADTDALHAAIDALPDPRARDAPAPRQARTPLPPLPSPVSAAPARGIASPPEPVATAEEEVAPADPRLVAIEERLTQLGYRVLVGPRAGIPLAAERAAHPQRIVGHLLDHLARADADRILAEARGLEVDAVLVVARSHDPEAARRFIATRARLVPEAEVDRFTL